MNKERPFEGITPVPNIKVGYSEKEAYLEIIDRQAKQIDSFRLTIMALQSRIDILEKSKRPQGAWIKIFENPFTNGYVCPFCGHKIQVTEQFLPKVTECEVCEADMGGGKDHA